MPRPNSSQTFEICVLVIFGAQLAPEHARVELQRAAEIGAPEIAVAAAVAQQLGRLLQGTASSSGSNSFSGSRIE